MWFSGCLVSQAEPGFSETPGDTKHRNIRLYVPCLLYGFSVIVSEVHRLTGHEEKGEMELKILPDAMPYQTNSVHERADADKELVKLLQSKILRPYYPDNPIHCTQ